jgi:hypothetical protein
MQPENKMGSPIRCGLARPRSLVGVKEGGKGPNLFFRIEVNLTSLLICLIGRCRFPSDLIRPSIKPIYIGFLC